EVARSRQPPCWGPSRCRVALGGYPPRAPPDPDVRNYRIRLVRPTLHTRRYTKWTTRAAGSGIRSSRPHRPAHPRRPFQLRRESHFRQIRATMALIRFNEEQFPVTPYLASADIDTTVKSWNPATGKSIRTIRGHPDPVSAVAFSPDGKRLASASFDT